MAKNKLSDLNNHLFASIERLGDEELKSEELKEEIQRAKSINEISKQIISNARITLDATRLIASGQVVSSKLPEMIGAGQTKAIDS